MLWCLAYWLQLHIKCKTKSVILISGIFPLGLGKQIDAISKKSGCDVAGLWRKSIVNHVYYVAATCDGDPDLIAAMWTSLANHVQNIHEHDDDAYPKCDHAPLVEEDRNKEWLRPGKCYH